MCPADERYTDRLPKPSAMQTGVSVFTCSHVHHFSLASAACLLCRSDQPSPVPPRKPTLLRILLVTGGCCHNYPLQTQQFTNAMAKVAAAEWTVVKEGGTGTRAEISLYDNPDWAKGYDVVVHNECFADTTNPVYLRKITSAHHAGAPAVVIHCAMHTYRGAGH
jgi:hypothetical protein